MNASSKYLVDSSIVLAKKFYSKISLMHVIPENDLSVEVEKLIRKNQIPLYVVSPDQTDAIKKLFVR
ncbi:MAG: hypothetical protein JXP36_20245 [Bacteroidales bacterium]|nr:hypothetical protein [Bacteroidales bacterium]